MAINVFTGELTATGTARQFSLAITVEIDGNTRDFTLLFPDHLLNWANANPPEGFTLDELKEKILEVCVRAAKLRAAPGGATSVNIVVDSVITTGTPRQLRVRFTIDVDGVVNNRNLLFPDALQTWANEGYFTTAWLHEEMKEVCVWGAVQHVKFLFPNTGAAASSQPASGKDKKP